MKLRRPQSWRYTIHFCGWDRQCRDLGCSWFLYLNFLAGSDGMPVRIDLTPLWIKEDR